MLQLPLPRCQTSHQPAAAVPIFVVHQSPAVQIHKTRLTQLSWSVWPDHPPCHIHKALACRAVPTVSPANSRGSTLESSYIVHSPLSCAEHKPQRARLTSTSGLSGAEGCSLHKNRNANNARECLLLRLLHGGIILTPTAYLWLSWRPQLPTTPQLLEGLDAHHLRDTGSSTGRVRPHWYSMPLFSCLRRCVLRLRFALLLANEAVVGSRDRRACLFVICKFIMQSREEGRHRGAGRLLPYMCIQPRSDTQWLPRACFSWPHNLGQGLQWCKQRTCSHEHPTLLGKCSPFSPVSCWVGLFPPAPRSL